MNSISFAFIMNMLTHVRDEVLALDSSNAKLRSFGYTVGGIVFAVGGVMYFRGGGTPSVGMLGAGALLVALGFFIPRMLLYVYRAWMAAGIFLGLIVSPLIFGLLFVLIIVPVGVVRRVFGADPLKLKKDPSAETYWVSHDPRGPEHMKHPF